MSIRDVLRREFSPSAMIARARRHDALAAAQYHLDVWRDYGDPASLDTAVRLLRERSS